MRVVFFSTCPANTYSGGRYHALIAAYCLARRGHEVAFVTDNVPIFDADLAALSPDNPVRIVLASTFDVDTSAPVDAVFIAPQMGRKRVVYSAAIELAQRHGAALAMFCYESPNWFNALSPAPRPLAGWAEWNLPAARGALILCSAMESRRYAEVYFADRPAETVLDVWQPAINSVAMDAAPEGERNRVVMFVRPGDRHKGADIVHKVLNADLRGNRLTLVIGKAAGSEGYVKEITEAAAAAAVDLEVLYALSDAEKFALLKSARALLFPSFFEGYGYPPVEAVGSGTPCIAYDLPVIRETCGDHAIYAPLGDRDALVAALEDLLAAPATVDAQPPDVRFLADVDIRAEALEQRLLAYIAGERPAPLPVLETPDAEVAAEDDPAEDGASDPGATDASPESDAAGDLASAATDAEAEVEVGQTEDAVAAEDAVAVVDPGRPVWISPCRLIGEGEGRLAVLGVAAPHRIVDVSLPAEGPDGAARPGVVAPLYWSDGAWQHTILLPAAEGSDLATILAGARLRFADGAAGSLPDLAEMPEAMPLADGASGFGVHRVTEADGAPTVHAWAMPVEDYDSAIWLTEAPGGLTATVGSVGLANPWRPARSADGLLGGLRFGLATGALEEAVGHRVLLTRSGRLVFQARVERAALEAAIDPGERPQPLARPEGGTDLAGRTGWPWPPAPASHDIALQALPDDREIVRNPASAVAEPISARGAVLAPAHELPPSLQPAFSVSKCEFNQEKRELLLTCWILTKEPVVLALRERESGKLVVATSRRTPREDVAKKHGVKDFVNFGLECKAKLESFDASAHVLVVTMATGRMSRPIPADKVKVIGKPAALTVSRPANLPPLDPSLPVELRISRAIYHTASESLEVSGWCLTPERSYELRVSSPELDLYEAVTPATQARPDLLSRYPEYQSSHAGWHLRTLAPPVAEGTLIKALYNSSKSSKTFSAKVQHATPDCAIEDCVFDQGKQRLTVKGWIHSEAPALIVVVDKASGLILGQGAQRKPRPDIALQFASPQFKDFGIDVSADLRDVSDAGLEVHFVFAACTVVKGIDRVLLTGSKTGSEYRILSQSFDAASNLAWVRGSFVNPGMRLSSVEMLQDDLLLATGVCNVKQLRLTEPNAGFRFEGFLPPEFDPARPVEIRGWINSSLYCRTSLTFAPEVTTLNDDQQLLDLVVRWGVGGAADRLLDWRDPEGRPEVLLMVHNLDAVDRPEKVAAIASLRTALDRQGLGLVVLHHSRNPIPGEFREVNFFDPRLNQLAQRDANDRDCDPALAPLLPALRESLVRKLYGFYGSLNRAPRPWADCEAQIVEEIRKASFVLRHLRPRAVLLWHQWVSLMEVGRAISSALNIPSAYLHEGMLPRTMTFDPQGMMAEAGCVGAMLDPGHPQAGLWLDRADAVIADIRENRRDRKPLSPLNAATALRARAEGMGARLVFYAGINDWHSGNLPRNTAAPLHSPHVTDTLDGLSVLLAQAEARNWLVMFKPHPNLYPHQPPEHPRLVVLRESNPLDCLRESDVMVTILSSLSYIALANGRRVVQLGRNTLTGTGAVHEVAGRDGIGAAIDAALAETEGMAQARHDRFRRHVAELLRQHLYAYDPEDTAAVLDHDALAQGVARLAGVG